MTALATEKPAYRIPLMEEIRATPSCGLRFVSTFSGCGGSCLGFEMAGYEPLAACEFVPAAIEAYADNHPGVPILTDDIRGISGDRLLELIGLEVGELDVLEGSPPCESFSTSGKLARNWGRQSSYSDGMSQRLDDLFFDFSRLVGELRPRAFIAENVAGLVKGVSKGYFKRIFADLASNGYRVEARLLDAQWLGVPQARRRVIFVGVREDLGPDPAFPDPLPYRYSLRDALPWIDGLVQVAGRNKGRPVAKDNPGRRHSADVPAPTVQRLGLDDVMPQQMLAREVPRQAWLRGELRVEWAKLHAGESSDRWPNLVRASSDLPSPTILRVGGASNLVTTSHPTQPRKFTIPELRRICGFPDDFELKGSYQQQWERLGNAVPPPMMRAVAESLRDRVLLAPGTA